MSIVAREYLENRIKTASPLELVVILYEGAIQHVLESRAAMEAKQLEKKVNAINRASRFIAELQLSLNMDQGGEISTSLAKLYNYMQGRLMEANIQNSIEILDELLKLLRTLHEAWTQVSKQPATAATMSAAPLAGQKPTAAPASDEPKGISISI